MGTLGPRACMHVSSTCTQTPGIYTRLQIGAFIFLSAHFFICVCLRQIQRLWQQYVLDAHGCCSTAFWKLYAAVRTQTRTCRDTVMHVVKQIARPECSTPGWPRSTRTLREKVYILFIDLHCMHVYILWYIVYRLALHACLHTLI